MALGIVSSILRNPSDFLMSVPQLRSRSLTIHLVPQDCRVLVTSLKNLAVCGELDVNDDCFWQKSGVPFLFEGLWKHVYPAYYSFVLFIDLTLIYWCTANMKRRWLFQTKRSSNSNGWALEAAPLTLSDVQESAALTRPDLLHMEWWLMAFTTCFWKWSKKKLQEGRRYCPLCLRSGSMFGVLVFEGQMCTEDVPAEHSVVSVHLTAGGIFLPGLSCFDPPAFVGLFTQIHTRNHTRTARNKATWHTVLAGLWGCVLFGSV